MSLDSKTPETLDLARELREQLVEWARAATPNEACGLLLGRTDSQQVEVRDVRAGRNVARDPAQAFELHPEDHLALTLEAERAGLAIVGAWHSHPRGPARPSATDRASAWDGWLHAIVGRDTRGEFELRVWRVRGEAWTEIARSTAASERGARETSDRNDQ